MIHGTIIFGFYDFCDVVTNSVGGTSCLKDIRNTVLVEYNVSSGDGGGVVCD